MQINNLKDLFKGIVVPRDHEKAKPKPTPPPEKNKVVGDPTRVPVNKQAAMLLSPIKTWLAQPMVAERPPDPRRAEIEAVKNELKIERNRHAETRDELGIARDKIRKLQRELEKQVDVSMSLAGKLKEQEGVIKQLEDIKL